MWHALEVMGEARQEGFWALVGPGNALKDREVCTLFLEAEDRIFQRTGGRMRVQGWPDSDLRSLSSPNVISCH